MMLFQYLSLGSGIMDDFNVFHGLKIFLQYYRYLHLLKI